MYLLFFLSSVADSLEHWLVLHSAEVECLDMGDSIKETQILIDRLNVLERNTLPQISRYEKVKQLTKVCLDVTFKTFNIQWLRS